jgi:hypothetical protein
MNKLRPAWLVYGVVAAIGAGLLYYSQTASFAWDEGFHLLAAQLIKGGKRPYADFFFAQTPLNAYLNAFWMSLFGETWRVPHAVDAVLSWATVFLVAQYVWSRLPSPPGWRAAGAVVAAVSAGLNVQFVEFSTVQAYGPALFFAVAAFRMTMFAVRRPRWYACLAAGILGGAAPACTLLTAPVPVVLLLWMWFCGAEAPRRLKPAPLLFIAGAIVPFIPVLVLLVQAPGPTFFDLVKYHMFYRREGWSSEVSHDFDVLTAWINSGQPLLLFLLAALGLAPLWSRLGMSASRGGWDDSRSELRLCAWLSLALIVHLSIARPTFERYFLLVTPFMGILAAAGFVTVCSRLVSRPLWPAVAYSVLISAGLARILYDDRDDFRWRDFEPVAKKVAEVAPPGSPILGDEHVYFLAKRQPPSGMEYADSHKLKLPAEMARSLHVVPRTEVERWVKAGLFSTIETCEEDETIEKLGLKRTYRNSAAFEDCHVFWDHRP